MKRFLAFGLLAASLPLAAQVDNRAVSYTEDAGTFGRVSRGGTARSIGLGNATTALGGDMGVTTTNPAGLGVYRRSEINFSPVFGVSGGSGTYLDKDINDSKGYFAVNNMGVVFYMPSANDQGYKGGSLSFGMNRVHNYHNRISFAGVNSKNNFGDYLCQISKGKHATDLENNFKSGSFYDLATLAYGTWVTNPFNSFPKDTLYHTLYESETVQQKGVMTSKGAQYQWYAAYGGNFNDKLYFGLSVNMNTVRRDMSYAYIETPGKVSKGEFTAIPDTLINLTYYNNLKTTGTGISFSGGLTWKPSKGVRMGLSVISPVFYAMKDQAYQQMDVNNVPDNSPIPNPNYPQANYNYSTTLTVFKYSYRSPLRASGGFAMFLGKNGFITGDVEVVPYAAAKYTAKDKTVNTFIFDKDNQNIKDNYKTVFNFRTGAEFRTGSFLMRGGFAYLGDPTKTEKTMKNNVLQFSGGFGLRGQTQYVDVALVNTRSKGQYSPYTLKNGTQPVAELKYSGWGVVISGGVYF